MEAIQSAQQAHITHLKAKLHLIPESLLTFSRHVLDDLSPAIAETLDSSEVLVPAICDEINRVFKALTTLSPTPHLLKQTQIHLALESIYEPDIGWPDALSSRAESLLIKWHDEISKLKVLEDMVWGEDGALAGCSEILVEGEHGWLIKMKNGKRPKDSLVTGDLGFYPGLQVRKRIQWKWTDILSWWINRAAAVRDGIISSICNDITFDRGGAYAVIITRGCEAGGDPSSIGYDGTGVDGSFRLLKTMTRSRNLVRVLLEQDSTSLQAPEFGIRYEGLYRVSKFFSKLEFNEDGSDRWTWRVHFERDVPQNAGPLRLARPDRDDIMIWRKYVTEREDHITTLASMSVDDKEDRQIF